MKLASSLYLGGELIPAAGSDYTTSRESGIVCPFCKEAVFLSREHERQGLKVSSSWRHYKMSTNSILCDNRALSAEGKQMLKQLQPESQGQRLKMFNRKFWEIYKHKKAFPPLKATCLEFIDEPTLDLMVKHCHERWDVQAIVKAIPETLSVSQEALENNVVFKQLARQLPDTRSLQVIIENFTNTKFSILHHKICCEVVAWLGTRSAYSSFEKVIHLAFLDAVEALPQPIHSNQVANMATCSIALTPWEEAIEVAGDRGIGFSR
ncbi:hypothetical protein QT972_09660 [Microcoleus sp. herbarium7]|uniref:hypothetical protein n=1 Tax=Microcoleus sp. herbarium7 TaxID=3055435 RepID=UPI002FCF3415